MTFNHLSIKNLTILIFPNPSFFLSFFLSFFFSFFSSFFHSSSNPTFSATDVMLTIDAVQYFFGQIYKVTSIWPGHLFTIRYAFLFVKINSKIVKKQSRVNTMENLQIFMFCIYWGILAYFYTNDVISTFVSSLALKSSLYHSKSPDNPTQRLFIRHLDESTWMSFKDCLTGGYSTVNAKFAFSDFGYINKPDPDADHERVLSDIPRDIRFAKTLDANRCLLAISPIAIYKYASSYIRKKMQRLTFEKKQRQQRGKTARRTDSLNNIQTGLIANFGTHVIFQFIRGDTMQVFDALPRLCDPH